MRGLLLSIVAVVVLVVTSGCGSSGGAGTVVLKFENTTPGVIRAWERFLPVAAPRMNMYNPSSLKLKIVSVYLSADLDANKKDTGVTAPIYINPVCKGSDKATDCDVAGGTATYTVTDFFELGVNSATVATNIPTIASNVPAGSYKYLRIRLCNHDGNATPVIEFNENTGAMANGAYAYAPTTCVLNSTATTLAVAEKTQTITLSYDYTNAIMESVPSTGPECSTDAPHECLTFPAFTAAVQ